MRPTTLPKPLPPRSAPQPEPASRLATFEPMLLIIIAGHLLWVGGLLLCWGMWGMGIVLLGASAGLAIRAKRSFFRILAVWDEEVQAMSAGEMGEDDLPSAIHNPQSTISSVQGGAL